MKPLPVNDPDLAHNPIDRSNFIKVYSLANASDEFYYATREHIKNEFKRSAAAFANHIAKSTGESYKSNKEKNKALAKTLTEILRATSYLVFSRVDPCHPEGLRAKNLIFLLYPPDQKTPPDLAFGESAFILAPRKKLSLPFHLVGRAGRQAAEPYIPLNDGVRITLPLNPKALAVSGRKAKDIANACAQKSVLAQRTRNTTLAEAIHKIDSSVVLRYSGIRGKPNRDRSRVGRYEMRRRSQMTYSI